MPDTSIRTLRHWIAWTAERLEAAGVYCGHGTDNAWSEAEFLVLRALQLPLDLADAERDQLLPADQKESVMQLINARITTRKPAAYLLGEAWFAGLRFVVNEHVLVPRSPIAELIQERFSPWCRAGAVRRMLDIGTGSGCIAVASALAFPEATVDAIDISAEALAVAQVNAIAHGVQQRVNLIRSDLFQELGERQYDLIVANPPYVDETDFATMPAEYRHEPAAALRAGVDGLDVARRVLHVAGKHLAANGVLIMEVGNSETALVQQYPQLPFLWLEFEHGGSGVLLLTREELQRWFSCQGLGPD